MRSTRARFLATLAVAWLPAAAHATTVSSLALTTGFDGTSPTAVGVSAWLLPALSVEGARGTLAVDGRFSGSRFQGPDGAGRLRLSTMLRDRGLVRPELFVTAVGRSRLGLGVLNGIRANLSGAHTGAWLSAAAEASAGGEQSESLRLPLLGFGAWARGHHLTLSGAVEQNVGMLRAKATTPAPGDTNRTGVSDPGAAGLRFSPEQVLLSTAYASARWDGDRFEVESVAGVTVGALTAPRRWAQASVAWRLSQQVALVATAGSRSPQYWALDPAGERQAAIALRVSPANILSPRVPLASRAEALGCSIRPIGDGVWRVIVRAPGARLVELQGDVTQWQPMALHPVSGERWEGEIDVPPGVHQLGLRVDGGAWMPPPSLPTAPDGFGGTMGILVAE